jgi:hypothetical protein
MGRRQQRIFQRDILQQASALVGLEANILLASQVTLHGVILEISGNSLTVKDMRLKKHVIPLSDIHEIMLDKAAEW